MGKLEIDPSRWSALNRLLDEALNRPADERLAWMDSLGDEFAPLKPELRELLSRAASVETGEFLETLPKFDAGDIATATPHLAAGQQVGGYRLVRELGAGGMGSVWLAERSDGLIQRPVALKLPHLVAARGAGLAERMARERQILATLDHPNIAKLLDAGITPDGQPFLALEYVEGVPIDQVAGGAGAVPLDIAARLRLFRQAAEAVAYAHGKLIVHRDLKPANILVTPQGSVKLLDFGIAKLLEQGEAVATRLTEIAGRALTPDYASPEQILGEPLTVASDVYSLGVVLHELLTGTRPYRLGRTSRAALEEAILRSEPPRPSQVVTAALRRQLRGDLDTIVSKALKKNPQERYATVNALADDISRHLDRRPVLARPDSGWYRLRRFVARHRIGVAAAATATMAVIAGAGVAMWQAHVAVAEQRRADVVKGFLVDLFKSANPSFNGGRKVTVDQLLLASHQKINQEFAQRPEIRAELLAIVGENLSAIGEGAAALPIYQEAVSAAEKAFGPDHVLTLQARSLVLTARREVDPGADVSADTDRLIEAMRRNRDVDPAYLSNLLAQRTQLALNAGQYPVAVKYAGEALDLSSKHIGEQAEQNLNNATLLAFALARNGDWQRSLQAATEVRRLVFEVRKLPDDHFNAVDARLMHGMALADAGELRAGLDEMREAIGFMYVRRKPDDPAVGSYRAHLGRYQLRAGLEAAAVDNLRAAVEIGRQALGEKSRRCAAASAELGLAYLSMRRPADAIAPLQVADAYFAGSSDLLARVVPARLAVARALSQAGASASPLGGEPANWEMAYRNAQLERLAGRPEKAEVSLQQALRMLGNAPAEQLPRAEVTLEMGRVQFDQGRLGEARQSFQQAGELMKRVQLERSAALIDAESWQARANPASGAGATR